MKALRSNLDENNRMWWCIGKVKGCTDEDSRETCGKCIPAGEPFNETVSEVVERIEEMPDVPLDPLDPLDPLPSPSDAV